MLPHPDIVADIHNLWDEMADFSAANIDEALRHCMKRLVGLIDAHNVTWVGAVRLLSAGRDRRPGLKGWRAVSVRHMSSLPDFFAASDRAKDEHETAPSATTLALIKGSGKFRAHRLHEKGFIDLKSFKRTDHYHYIFKAFDIRDRIYCVTPVNEQAESFFLIDRTGSSDARFRKRDAVIVSYALRGLKWFQKELMLAHGLNIADKPLSMTERRIVRLMLTDKTEREIAEVLKQSPHTTHGYIKGILRKYGVRGRTGLMALWLSRVG